MYKFCVKASMERHSHTKTFALTAHQLSDEQKHIDDDSDEDEHQCHRQKKKSNSQKFVACSRRTKRVLLL